MIFIFFPSIIIVCLYAVRRKYSFETGEVFYLFLRCTLRFITFIPSYFRNKSKIIVSRFTCWRFRRRGDFVQTIHTCPSIRIPELIGPSYNQN